MWYWEMAVMFRWHLSRAVPALTEGGGVWEEESTAGASGGGRSAEYTETTPPEKGEQGG